MRALAKACLAGGLGVVCSLTFPMAASATSPGWQVLASANPTTLNGTLLGLKCESSTACIAVGYFMTAGGIDQGLAEEWNGTTWSASAVPAPVGAFGSELEGISCLTADNCTAVGYYFGSSNVDETLAETWDGTSWTPATPPNPSSSTSSQLLSVSCPTTTSCTAVGVYAGTGGDDETLAEGWNGTAWTIEPTPSNGLDVVASQLASVYCLGVSQCLAAGYVDESGSEASIIEDWDGTAWSFATIPVISDLSDELRSVTCTSSSDCTAVGLQVSLAGVLGTLAESWDGVQWSVDVTPDVSGSTSDGLVGVACESSSDCVAVGYYTPSTGGELPLTLVLDGTSWATEPVPISGSTGYLSGVDCASSTDCTAVGRQVSSSGVDDVLGASWNGTTWSASAVVNLPGALSSNALTDVACNSSTSCVAVGNGASSSFSEAWNGASFPLSTVVLPSGATATELAAVACPASKSCTAAGDYSSRGVDEPLIEAGNGESWKQQTAPTFPDSTSGILASVSCGSTKSCMAVGDAVVSGADVALVEYRNGGKWVIETAPAPAGATASELSSVSCTSPTACVAVGSYTATGISKAFAEVWNGTKLTVSKVAMPGVAVSSGLNGVSCTSATSCQAVGDYVNSKGDEVLAAESWAGTNWSPDTLPRPSAPLSYLSAISCSTATSCLAVGSYSKTNSDTPATDTATAEVLNGSVWSLEVPPSLLTVGSQFSGVSCVGTAPCMVVGNQYNLDGLDETLAEQYSP